MLNLNIFSKPVHEIKLRDIEELIEAKVPEGQQIEFKEELPFKEDEKDKKDEVNTGAKDRPRDPWYEGKNISREAKQKLSEEVVAFANAQGGTLLLGIKESSNKPPIAAEITPLPRCVELADRLGNVFRDSVEPSIPMIKVFGVPVKKGGEGIVIIRVGRSRLAPHWAKRKDALSCKIRRADQSDQMTMWEVQNMTLNVSRGLERFERRLQERSERFQQEFHNLKTPEEAFGIRLTALPVGEEVRFDNGSQLKALFTKSPDKGGVLLPWEPVKMKVKINESDERLQKLECPYHPDSPQFNDWQLRLRGIRRRDLQSEKHPDIKNYCFDYQELHCDGLLEFGYLSCNHVSCENKEDPLLFSSGWPLILLANLAFWADCIRRQASAPMAEYGIQIEIQRRGKREVEVGKESIPKRLPCFMPPGDGIKFPNYSLPNDYSEEPRAALLLTFYRDFWNWFGNMAKNMAKKMLKSNLRLAKNMFAEPMLPY